MDYRILGPVALGGAPVNRPRERKILAALLVAGRPVSTGHLVDVLWPAAPPITARQQVQNCVSSPRGNAMSSRWWPRAARTARSPGSWC